MSDHTETGTATQADPDDFWGPGGEPAAEGARQPSKQTQRQPRPEIGNAAMLKAMRFEPIKWIVPDILAEGVCLIAGNPKIGKSWIALDIAIAVARGGYVLGEKKCIQGPVLYLALEDNERRLQRRITKLLGAFGTEWPADLEYATTWARIGAGGLDHIREWLGSVEHPRLIIIDTLAMLRDGRYR